jgi:hypothetical protein
MPNTTCEMGSAAKLVELINEEFDGCNVVAVHRRYFSEAMGSFQIDVVDTCFHMSPNGVI